MQENVCAVFYGEAGDVLEVRRCPAAMLARASDPFLVVSSGDAEDVSLDHGAFLVLDGALVRVGDQPAFVVRGLRRLDALAASVMAQVSGVRPGFEGLYQAKVSEARSVLSGGDVDPVILGREASRHGCDVPDLARRVLKNNMRQREREGDVEALRQHCQGLMRSAKTADAVAAVLAEFSRHAHALRE